MIVNFIRYYKMPSYDKLQKIAEVIDLPLKLQDLIQNPESIRVFDYSPISHPSFLSALFRVVEDDTVCLCFLNAARNEVKKSIALSPSEDNDAQLSELRRGYAILFDYVIDGSVLLYGTADEWLVYYDAEGCHGMLVEYIKKRLPDLDDYMKPFNLK